MTDLATMPHPEPTVFERRPRCRRHAVIGYKGGTGKTTCVLCTAEQAAKRGKNVLVVDTDGQGNATRRLQANDMNRPTLADVLHYDNPVPITDAVVPCGWDTEEFPWAARIHVVQAPSNAHMDAGCEMLETRAEESHRPGAHNRLRIAMLGVPEGHYDLVLFDTAPNMGHGLDMVLAALDDQDDRLWLCVNPLLDSILGGQRFVHHVIKYRDLLGVPHLDIASVLVNDYRPSLEVHAQVYPTIPDAFSHPVAPEYLPRADRWHEVCNNGMPVAAYPELHRRDYREKGKPPLPSFVDRMEAMTGVIIDAK